MRFRQTKHPPKELREDRRGKILKMVGIHNRLSGVDERLVTVHWEGCLIKDKGNFIAFSMIFERTTLLTVLAKMENVAAE